MKIKSKTLSTGLLLSLILLTPASSLWAAGFPEKGDMIKGAKAWGENCTRCHNLREPNELSDDQWITTTFHMRIRGGLTWQETRDILTFLQQTN